NATLVGDHAHYDGARYITVTGNPYILNNDKNSVYYAEKIVFDAIEQKAELVNGRGESTQGVEQGKVYFSSPDLKTEADGVSHGDRPFVTTCERPRGGYHITGRTIDVKPGDRITITKAVLYLGAAAIFYLPKVVIPLRSVQDDRQKPQFFPDIGYNAYQGYYVKARIGFGRDQYYYGYYRVEFFSRVGLGLGYNACIQSRKPAPGSQNLAGGGYYGSGCGSANSRRSTSIDYYGIHDRQAGTSNKNLAIQDNEAFSPTLRGQFATSYQSNYGALANVPATTSINANLAHTTLQSSQQYTFSRNAVGSQSSQDAFGFTDQRTFSPLLTNTFNYSLTRSDSGGLYYGSFTSDTSSHISNQTHWASRGADYTLLFDKSIQSTLYGIDNKLPELTVRPTSFFQHFTFPISSVFTIGEYNEPQNALTTSRADLGFILGPALYHLLDSDFSATVNVDQYAYGTGDLKARVSQQASLSTVVGSHFVNSITYSESNSNGPQFVPFQNIDQLYGNTHQAQDVVRFFNSDYYNLSLDFGTGFNRQALPIGYQLTSRPSPRSFVSLGGSYNPGPGNGFYSTNVSFGTPLGRGATLQFIGDIDWKSRGRIENKNVYYSRIIGDCYQFLINYNQSLRQVNFTVNILAFPSHSANFGLSTQGGPIFQNGLNSY
ncbi:MAG: hypothetical protein M3R35_03975, partial [Candidatus Eremiobacteraeota bacterium]|nr:hypothetical protein [Candidatus Eremiobacteraeota bacterium]